ncbi:hypothetical protein [Luteimonas pelagia]
MKFVWILVGVVCLIALGSLVACPHDIHGSHTCSSAAQAGRALGFYVLAPGLWVGSVMSDVVTTDPHAGASFPAYVLGVVLWLALVFCALRFIAGALARARHR